MELEVACCVEQIEETISLQREEKINHQDLKQTIQEKESQLSEVLKAILGEKIESIDEHLNDDIFDAFVSMEAPEMDYSSLFSYLDSGIKENPYIEYTPKVVKKEEQEEDIQEESISYEEVVDIIKLTADSKILMGQNHELDIDKVTKDRFEDYKMFNQAFNMVLYKMMN